MLLEYFIYYLEHSHHSSGCSKSALCTLCFIHCRQCLSLWLLGRGLGYAVAYVTSCEDMRSEDCIGQHSTNFQCIILPCIHAPFVQDCVLKAIPGIMVPDSRKEEPTSSLCFFHGKNDGRTHSEHQRMCFDTDYWTRALTILYTSRPDRPKHKRYSKGS